MLPEEIFHSMIGALHFAALRHRDQRRKDPPQSPYINHLIHVLDILWNVGEIRDRDVLIAAVLHDTLEDTNTMPEEISAHFGENVCHLVQEVTDDKSLPKAERKRLQIEHAPTLSLGAKLIKLADKINNLHDVGYSPPDWPPQRKLEYLQWSRDVVAALRGTHPALEALFDQTANEVEMLLKTSTP